MKRPRRASAGARVSCAVRRAREVANYNTQNSSDRLHTHTSTSNFSSFCTSFYLFGVFSSPGVFLFVSSLFFTTPCAPRLLPRPFPPASSFQVFSFFVLFQKCFSLLIILHRLFSSRGESMITQYYSCSASFASRNTTHPLRQLIMPRCPGTPRRGDIF